MEKEGQEIYCIRVIYKINSDSWNQVYVEPLELSRRSRVNRSINLEEYIECRRKMSNLSFK